MGFWDSAEFRCLEDRVAEARMQCVVCGHTFETGVEYPEFSPEWVVVQTAGGHWAQMFLRCVKCGAQEVR